MVKMAERRKATDERIAKAAIIEFGKNGYANTTLASIAKSSGITPGLIVQNFGSKEELYRKISVEIVSSIQKSLRGSSQTWDVRCRTIVENSKKMLNDNPDAIHYLQFYVSLMTSLDSPEDVLRELYDIYKSSPVEEIIVKGQENDEIMDGEPYGIHTLFWSNMCNTVCYCYNNKLKMPETEWFLQLIRK